MSAWGSCTAELSSVWLNVHMLEVLALQELHSRCKRFCDPLPSFSIQWQTHPNSDLDVRTSTYVQFYRQKQQTRQARFQYFREVCLGFSAILHRNILLATSQLPVVTHWIQFNHNAFWLSPVKPTLLCPAHFLSSAGAHCVCFFRGVAAWYMPKPRLQGKAGAEEAGGCLRGVCMAHGFRITFTTNGLRKPNNAEDVARQTAADGADTKASGRQRKAAGD